MGSANPEDIKKIVKKYEGKEFVFIKERGWWFVNPSKYHIDKSPLNERVETRIMQTLKQNFKVTMDTILKDMFETYRNAQTPNPPSIRAVLEEYAKKTKDGKWKLKPQVKMRESEHDRIVSILSEIGKKIGCEVYADLQDRRYDLEKVPISKEISEKIKQIDVLWFNPQVITHEFEVEHTTGITEAIRRGANIPYEVNRLIVIPEERINMLLKKLTEPWIKEGIDKYGWKFIFYDELKNFYRANKRKKQIKLEDFEKIIRVPKLKVQTQRTLD